MISCHGGDTQAGRSFRIVMHLEAHQEREKAPAILLAGLIVLAFALRFWRLGQYNFEATEMFTLRDSFSPQFTNPRPLQYLLNYYVVRPFLPLDEFGLRLLPAIFGVLAIPAFYLVCRRLVGTRAALLGTLLLAVSPLHIYQSQFARYWSLVFLLSAIYPYALYIGVRERDPRALVLGLVTAALAVLAHPVSLLLLGGLGIWFIVSYVRPSYLAQMWSQRNVRWATFLGVVLVAAIAARFIPMLHRWITAHDKAPGSGQFLILTPGGTGVKQIFYLLAYVDMLTLPLVLTAALGILLLWQERDRSLALMLTCLAAFPVVSLTLLSLRTAVSTFYLLPTAPVFYIGAGLFLERLSRVNWELRPRWLLSATVGAIIFAAGLPTLISHYLNGRRYDFRDVAHWLDASLEPGDVVFSDQPMVLAHYLPGTPVQRLRIDTVPLVQSVHVLRESGGKGALWIVVPAPSHALRGRQNIGSLKQWIYDNCQLRTTIGVGSLDLRQQYLQVYRCSAALPSGQAQAWSRAVPISP
jgi:mannosyltransferase